MIEDRIELREHEIWEELEEKGKTDLEIIDYFLGTYAGMLMAGKVDEKIVIDNLDEMDIHFITRINAFKRRKKDIEKQNSFDAKVDALNGHMESPRMASLAQKMIYLNELGILEHLQTRYEFGGSENAIAYVLGKITGENQTSIQPLINIILSDKDIQNPKNPYSTTKKR